ncbi:adenosine deaminase [Formivibrio citricus]|uniref:Adenine deaminase n=1 Tax=Formivibrio citricus TaxID=83765 RepID=A0A1I4YAL7_9NEIS|nr:adenosine deaminase [Formivibrio citricus]SFN35054.1 adenosine deaminase [Formivibrio citricus]
MNPQAIDDLIRALPKAELHVHIEGTLEPELMFKLARRNGIKLPYASVDEVRAAYQFTDLQSFLDLYYAGASVLVTEEDFYDLTWAYCQRAHADNVVHTEIFFDPQTHTVRGVSFETMLNGITRALSDALLKYGMTSRRIMCFLRHLPEADCLATLEQAKPYLERIHGVGLDSGEKGNPPSKFKRLFQRCRSYELPVVAHAGEEGPASYITEALDILGAKRIDHGVRCVEDPELVHRLARDKVPLTVCPLSNLKLCVVDNLEKHNLRDLLHAGLCVTVNSDDPAYFGGYMNDNLLACRAALNLSDDDVVQLVLNSFEASWLRDADKTRWENEVTRIALEWEKAQGVQ